MDGNPALLYANLSALKQIRDIAEAVPAATIYLMKGAALAAISDRMLVSRPMEDIDILTRPEESSYVRAALKRLGYKKRAGDPQTYENRIYPCPVDVHDGIWYSADPGRIFLRASSAEGFPANVKIFAGDDLAADVFMRALTHGFADAKWGEDLVFIREKFGRAAVAAARKKIRGYCSAEIFEKFCAYIDAPRPAGRTFHLTPSAERRFPGSGFALKFAAAPGLAGKAACAAELFFPSEDFIRRRYDVEGAAVTIARFLRPVFLAAFFLKSAFLFLSARPRRETAKSPRASNQ